MTTHAQSERRQLAGVLDQLGPDAPTLCEGWRTADLAAHLVVRERRPDAAAGILLPGLASYTRQVQESVRDGQPWSALVNQVRHGPPLALRLLDEAVNTVEYFIHHEDARRAQPGWAAREVDPSLERALWARISSPFGRLLARRAPVGVTLAAPGFGTAQLKGGRDHITVSGPPSELALFLFGRVGASLVTLAGDPPARSQLRQARLGL